jgi:aspartyl-tRNA synthetase
MPILPTLGAKLRYRFLKRDRVFQARKRVFDNRRDLSVPASYLSMEIPLIVLRVKPFGSRDFLVFL